MGGEIMVRSAMKLGVNPLSWMNSDIPELGSHIPVEQCLIDAGSIGYEGIELEDPFKKILDRFPQLLKKHGLKLVAGWHSTFLLENSLEKEREQLKRHMDLLASLGGSVVNLAECSRAVHREGRPLSTRPRLNDAEWKRLCEGMESLAETIEDQSFVSAYHHHMGTVVQDGADIDRLMAGTEKLGLLFDSGHLRYAGVKPLELLRRHALRVTHVHCKNVRSSVLREKQARDAGFFSAIVDGAFTVPGDDSDCCPETFIDFQKIIQLLAENGYAGWIIMEAEQDPKKADPYRYAKLGFDTLSRLIKRERGAGD